MPEPGWYVDPADAQGVRYWDGVGWTEHTRHAPTAPVAGDGPLRPVETAGASAQAAAGSAHHGSDAAVPTYAPETTPPGSSDVVSSGPPAPASDVPGPGGSARIWPWTALAAVVVTALVLSVALVLLRDRRATAPLEDVVAFVEDEGVSCDLTRPVHSRAAVVDEVQSISGEFIVPGRTTPEDEAAMASSVEPVLAVAQALPETAGYDLLRCNDTWIVVDATTAHAVLLGPSTEGALDELEGIGVPVEVLQLTA